MTMANFLCGKKSLEKLCGLDMEKDVSPVHMTPLQLFPSLQQ